MNILRRLYRGDTNVNFIAPRKRWYIASGLLIAICVGSMALKGFTFGIEFSGGNSFVVTSPANTTLKQASAAVESAGVAVQTAQIAGSGGQQKYVIKTEELTADKTDQIKQALSQKLGIPFGEVTDSAVSSSWGSQITQKGLIALAAFLVLVTAYIWIVFEQKMAIAALAALVHDLVLTAGVYSLIGFEVTPSTVIGLLTILGFSLYDTVVVFDKVQENTRGLLSGQSLRDYAQMANLAVNQTIMRSINTAVISLLPVGGLLFVGAGLLGVGTLKDLALVLFVGLLVGTYSSIFLATPWLVDLKEREPRYAALKRRVATVIKAESGGRAGYVGASNEELVAATSVEADRDATMNASSAATRRRGRHGRVPSVKRGRH
ncbi:MAG: protein translocase subunit SecF [Acidimicrobiales bacterium]|nr:MAG: protein translocase subunit SecF [Acidimicrobiales bacterium]